MRINKHIIVTSIIQIHFKVDTAGIGGREKPLPGTHPVKCTSPDAYQWTFKTLIEYFSLIVSDDTARPARNPTTLEKLLYICTGVA